MAATARPSHCIQYINRKNYPASQITPHTKHDSTRRSFSLRHPVALLGRQHSNVRLQTPRQGALLLEDRGRLLQLLRHLRRQSVPPKTSYRLV